MVPEREGFRNTRKWMDTVYVCAETEGVEMRAWMKGGVQRERERDKDRKEGLAEAVLMKRLTG